MLFRSGLAPKVLATAGDILDQILYEKRFSLLWQSPDRWYDSRMFGKLNGSDPPVGLGLENDLPPLENVPLPQGEIDARGGDLTQTCSGP